MREAAKQLCEKVVCLEERERKGRKRKTRKEKSGNKEGRKEEIEGT